MVGGFILALSLLFSVKRGVDMPTATTLPTAIVLTAFAVCYILLEFHLGAIFTALTATGWYIIFFKNLIAGN